MDEHFNASLDEEVPAQTSPTQKEQQAPITPAFCDTMPAGTIPIAGGGLPGLAHPAQGLSKCMSRQEILLFWSLYRWVMTWVWQPIRHHRPAPTHQLTRLWMARRHR